MAKGKKMIILTLVELQRKNLWPGKIMIGISKKEPIPSQPGSISISSMWAGDGNDLRTKATTQCPGVIPIIVE